jgi:hypothetical protein
LKKHGYSVYIPASRSQKGVDLIINKNATNNMARVQVKASRSYKGKGEKSHINYLWFRNFEGRYKKGDVDFYILFGLYPQPSIEKGVNSKNIWKSIFLCFNETEMFEFLAGVKTKGGRRDSFFGFSFDSAKKIHATKNEKIDVSGFLLEKKIGELKFFLDNGVQNEK